MISFGPMSITLLLCAVQGLVLAALLLVARKNREANRFLALLIIAMALLITPFIIGYAGFYDTWPWLSFAPFSYTMAFGPLIYFYTVRLTGTPQTAIGPHFAPVAAQFLADALVFPLPLATKDWWSELVHATVISPGFEIATLVSIGCYGFAALRQYYAYQHWLNANRTDGVDFDPRWIRNFLIALGCVGVIWFGFIAAKFLYPSRDYFDQFGLYVTFCALVIYLGIAGWRHAETDFPAFTKTAPDGVADDERRSPAQRDWAGQGRIWLAEIDSAQYWRDPDLTLTSLARHLGTNTAYLSRALNAGAGENFKTTINRRRVAAIQQWLLQPDDPRDMMTLAFDAGFSSKASFNRAFVDIAGMSPSAWRLKT